jgi:signal transduction histidine kinase
VLWDALLLPASILASGLLGGVAGRYWARRSTQGPGSPASSSESAPVGQACAWSAAGLATLPSPALAQLIESLPHSAWLGNPATGKLILWNKRTETLLCRSAAELSELVGHWGAWVHTLDRFALESALQRASLGRSEELVYRLRRGDGTWIWLRERLCRVGEEGGLLLGLAEDATQQREREQEVSLLEHQLIQAQKLQAVGQLASGVAHDLGNLLSVVRYHCDTVGSALIPGSAADQSLDGVRTALEAASSLSRSLVSFARSVRGTKRKARLRPLLGEFLPTLQRLIGPQIELRADLGPEPGPALSCDSGQLQQALLNLVLNARDALPQGGRVRLRLSTDEQQAHIDVIDQGPGIAPALRPFVFEPFFTTKSSSQGTGLGLAIVRRIAQEHGGQAILLDPPEGGAWVRLSLPLPEAPPLAPAPPLQRGVLLVDSVAQHRAILAADLMHAGFSVVQAHSLQRAEQVLASVLPAPAALVLIERPGAPGAIEMLARLRARGALAPALLAAPPDAAGPRLDDPRAELLSFPLPLDQLISSLENLLEDRGNDPPGLVTEIPASPLAELLP